MINRRRIYSDAELVAIELCELRLDNLGSYAHLRDQLLNLIAGRERGDKGHHGYRKPDGFTRSADLAVIAWVEHVRRNF